MVSESLNLSWIGSKCSAGLSCIIIFTSAIFLLCLLVSFANVGWVHGLLYSSCEPTALHLVPSELLLSTHVPTSEGWTAELAVGSFYFIIIV